MEAFLAKGAELTPKQSSRLSVLRQVYEQRKYMYENNTHTVADRIVSISQPYIRPIVRGKAAAPVEFGAKLDVSIDENGMARLEKLSFDAYNESDVLIGAIERYRERTGRYPERALADKIYRNRDNLMLWAWQDHDKTGCYHEKFHCIVYSGDECSTYSGSFIAAIFGGAVFKVQTAEFHAAVYAKLPRKSVSSDLMSRH